MADLLSPYYWLETVDGIPGRLGEIFCVSFFRGLTPDEVLRRFGPDQADGREMSFEALLQVIRDFTMRTRGGSGSGYVAACQVGEWSVAVELPGWCAILPDYIPSLSRDCEMVAVSRHDYAEDSFVYAVNSEVLTAFTPHLPGDRWGSDPGRIEQAMRKVGLPTESFDDDDEAWEESLHRLYEHRIARVFALAAEITGVAFTSNLLDGPLLVGAISQLT